MLTLVDFLMTQTGNKEEEEEEKTCLRSNLCVRVCVNICTLHPKL